MDLGALTYGRDQAHDRTVWMAPCTVRPLGIRLALAQDKNADNQCQVNRYK